LAAASGVEANREDEKVVVVVVEEEEEGGGKAAREGEAREWPTAEGETKASSRQRAVSYNVWDNGRRGGGGRKDESTVKCHKRRRGSQ